MPRPSEDLRTPRAAIKLCLAGDPAVGKTCLAIRYVFRRHEGRHRPTYRARIFRKRLRADFGGGGPGVQVDLELWDAPGHPTLFSVLHDVYFHNADGVLVVCDATRPRTLHDVAFWMKTTRHATAKAEMRILVNKVDRAKRNLRLQNLSRTARAFHAPWAVVSASSGQNVDGAFTGLIGEILLRKWTGPGREAPWLRPPLDAGQGRHAPSPYTVEPPVIPR